MTATEPNTLALGYLAAAFVTAPGQVAVRSVQPSTDDEVVVTAGGNDPPSWVGPRRVWERAIWEAGGGGIEGQKWRDGVAVVDDALSRFIDNKAGAPSRDGVARLVAAVAAGTLRVEYVLDTIVVSDDDEEHVVIRTVAEVAAARAAKK